MDENKLEVAKIQYKECGTHLRYMLEWRHKLLLRFFVLSASFLLVSKWLFDNKDPNIQALLFIPLCIYSIISFAFYVMDKRTLFVIKVCRQVGLKIESTLFENEALFTELGLKIEATRNFFSYTGMLALIYLGSSFLMLLFSIITFVKFNGINLFK